MHKALKLKRVADALAAAGGGWLPLTLKAWRKYVRRKRGKENARPALVAKPVVALLLLRRWSRRGRWRWLMGTPGPSVASYRS